MGSDTFPRPEDISKEGESRRPSKRLKPGDDTGNRPCRLWRWRRRRERYNTIIQALSPGHTSPVPIDKRRNEIERYHRSDDPPEPHPVPGDNLRQHRPNICDSSSPTLSFFRFVSPSFLLAKVGLSCLANQSVPTIRPPKLVIRSGNLVVLRLF